jgi:hypothetical protein
LHNCQAVCKHTEQPAFLANNTENRRNFMTGIMQHGY